MNIALVPRRLQAGQPLGTIRPVEVLLLHARRVLVTLGDDPIAARAPALLVAEQRHAGDGVPVADDVARIQWIAKPAPPIGDVLPEYPVAGIRLGQGLPGPAGAALVWHEERRRCGDILAAVGVPPRIDPGGRDRGRVAGEVAILPDILLVEQVVVVIIPVDFVQVELEYGRARRSRRRQRHEPGVVVIFGDEAGDRAILGDLRDRVVVVAIFVGIDGGVVPIDPPVLVATHDAAAANAAAQVAVDLGAQLELGVRHRIDAGDAHDAARRHHEVRVAGQRLVGVGVDHAQPERALGEPGALDGDRIPGLDGDLCFELLRERRREVGRVEGLGAAAIHRALVVGSRAAPPLFEAVELGLGAQLGEVGLVRVLPQGCGVVVAGLGGVPVVRPALGEPDVLVLPAVGTLALVGAAVLIEAAALVTIEIAIPIGPRDAIEVRILAAACVGPPVPVVVEGDLPGAVQPIVI